jgi:hypothetical protein
MHPPKACSDTGFAVLPPARSVSSFAPLRVVGDPVPLCPVHRCTLVERFRKRDGLPFLKACALQFELHPRHLSFASLFNVAEIRFCYQKRGPTRR